MCVSVCVAVVYELLYTKVFGCEEAELSQAVEVFRVGGRRYRNSLSVCSDVDFGYDIPEDRGHRYARVPARPRACTCRRTHAPTHRERVSSCRAEAESGEEKLRVLSDDVKVRPEDDTWTPPFGRRHFPSVQPPSKVRGNVDLC